MTPANRVAFTSFFQIWVSFIDFPCRIALARTWSVEVNRHGESRCPDLELDLDLSGKAGSLFMRMMLAMCFSEMPLIKLRKFLLFLVC